MKENFIPHVMVSPFGIWEILTVRNSEEVNHRRKLRIGMTGNVGWGAPSINALTETIEGFIGGRSLKEMKVELGAKGLLAEVPSPTYGYLGSDDFYHRSRDGDLINDWASDALKGLIYTDRQGRHTGHRAFICQIPANDTCACRYHMRYTKGIRLKTSQWEQRAELQIDSVALQRDILVRQKTRVRERKRERAT